MPRNAGHSAPPNDSQKQKDAVVDRSCGTGAYASPHFDTVVPVAFGTLRFGGRPRARAQGTSDLEQGKRRTALRSSFEAEHIARKRPLARAVPCR